jgi:O-antigen ligase
MTQTTVTQLFARLRAPAVWLLMAISSVVFIEPAPFDILLLALLPVLFGSGLRVPREIWAPALLLGIFTASNFLAALTAPYPVEAFRSLGIRTYMVAIWLVFLCLIASEPRQIIRHLWAGYLLAAVGATLFGIAEYFGYVQSVEWEPGQRARGPFKDPNVFGPFLVPATLHCLAQLKNRGPLRAPLDLSLFLLFSFGVLLSFSRGAWINYALSLALFVTVSFALSASPRQRISWFLTSAGLLVAALAVVLLALSSETVRTRFEQRAVISQNYDLKETGRFPVQIMSLKRIGVSPLGIGPGRAEFEFPQGPHNIYLQIPLEGGWLAGLSWFLFAILTIHQAARLLRWQSDLRDDLLVAFCALIGILVQSTFISSTHWRHMWLLFAMVWALVAIGQRDASHVPGAVPALRAVT